MSLKSRDVKRKAPQLLRLRYLPVLSGIYFCVAQSNAVMSQSGPATCTQPDPPGCIDRDSTYENSREILGCKTDIAHYITSVDAYRACLEGETTRAILEANEHIDSFKARMTANPAPRAASTVSHIADGPLYLNGSSGLLQFSFRGHVLRIEKLSLAGKVVSDPARPCEIVVTSETPLEAKGVAHSEGLARFTADIPACPFTFDVVDGAVLATPQSKDCVFQAADCQANPSGLWGPQGVALSKSAEMFKELRSRAETQMNIYFGGLSAGARDAKHLDDLKSDQADFSSRRLHICNRYVEESLHGFCSLQVTLARVALLKARLEALPHVSVSKQQH